jgi:CRISPR-associated protein Cas4
MVLILGVMLRLKKKSLDKRWNIPTGSIMYADIVRPEKALSSKSWLLRGKPDFIVKTKKGEIVPVELKSGTHNHPKPWHIMQLIAYCHLASETYNQSIPHGILVYSDTKKQFRIPYSEQYQNLLSSTITCMYDHMSKHTVSKIDDDSRCNQCSLNDICPEYENLDEK